MKVSYGGFVLGRFWRVPVLVRVLLDDQPSKPRYFGPFVRRKDAEECVKRLAARENVRSALTIMHIAK